MLFNRSRMRLDLKRRNDMAAAVYMFCAVTSIMCAALLLRTSSRSGARLLFWSGWAFACLALGNVFLFLDLALFPQRDLLMVRNLITLGGIGMMLYGLIFQSE
jgi:hypothetical protein